MKPLAKLLLDYVNMRGKMAVNRRGCFSLERTPELKWLIEHGYLQRKRETVGWYKSRIKTTVLYPTNPVVVEKLICPCCKADLSEHGAIWQTMVKGTSDYFDRAKHKYNCPLRIDHMFDAISPKRKSRL